MRRGPFTTKGAGSGGLNEEQVEDVIGAMVSGNTETGITVTYDDGTDKLNFDASKALDDLTDVTITSVATGNTVRYSGSAWVNVFPLARVFLGQDEGTAITDATAPTIGAGGRIIDAALTIPAATFVAGDVFEVDCRGTLTNNSGASRSYTFTLTFGTTTLTVTTNVFATSAVAKAWRFQAVCRMETATDQNWQLAAGGHAISGALSNNVSTENVANALAFDLAVQSSANTATQTLNVTQLSLRKIGIAA